MALITPYGGKLINLLSEEKDREVLKQKANSLKKIQLSTRSLCDLELLATGAFSPLDQFMGVDDYKSVLKNMRLTNGMLFPIPITLPIADDDVQVGDEITLTDQYQKPLAIMQVAEKFQWQLDEEALSVYQTLDQKHPVVSEMQKWGKYYIAGKLQVINLPSHPDFKNIRYTPKQLRELLVKINTPHVVAFQTRNPMHRAHEELTKQAMRECNAILLLQPVVGLTKPKDVDYYTRVRAYQALVENYYPKDQVILSLLQLAMRMGGPREVLLHMIIRRNFGSDYFIVGRDHAGPGNNSQGKPFYEPYAAQEIAQQYENELGIKIIPFKEFVYLPDENIYTDRTKISPEKEFWNISGTQVREDYLKHGKLLPEWFTRKECAEILAENYPPLDKRGTCLWFTGLPCAGKTTIAEIIYAKLMERGKMVTFCDGDVIRKHFATGLNFSLADREVYLKRVGFLATEIVRQRGFIIVAAISPMKQTRHEIRREVSDVGNFIEIFVDTPVNVCTSRDVKGLYQKAIAGEIKDYTGVSSPYEIPENPEIRLTTENKTPDDNAEIVLNYLIENKIVML